MESVTGIGSLPLTDPQAAIRLVAQVCPDVPFWPQLPRRSSRERMIEQALGPRSAFFVPRKTGYGYRIKPGLLRVCVHEWLDGIATLDEHSAVLTTVYTWLILVFGEPLGDLPSSAPVKLVLGR